MKQNIRAGVDNHTDDKNTEDVEEDDSVEGLSDGGGDGLSRVLPVSSAQYRTFNR
jgi:hypothetical protein